MQMIANMGSIQAIFGIPAEIKRKYRTVWEISQKSIIEMAADRAPFICQSQSLNIHIAGPTYAKISSMHFYGWKTGLKTGMYYLRSKPAAAAIQFTVDQTKLKKNVATDAASVADANGQDQEQRRNREAMVCSLQNKDDCLMCGS